MTGQQDGLSPISATLSEADVQPHLDTRAKLTQASGRGFIIGDVVSVRDGMVSLRRVVEFDALGDRKLEIAEEGSSLTAYSAIEVPSDEELSAATYTQVSKYDFSGNRFRIPRDFGSID